MTRDRICVLGCGSIGRRHLANLRRLGVFAWGVEPDAVVRRRAEEETGARIVAEMEEPAFAEASAAIIATPPAFHLPQALAAASAGCHLFIEKPLGVSDAGWDGVEEELARHRRIGFVACNLRYTETFRRLQTLLESEACGRPLAARIVMGSFLPAWRPGADYRKNYAAGPPEEGGGVILDDVHEIDLALALFGEVERVSARTLRTGVLEISSEDTADILLDFRCGVRANLHMNYLERDPVRRFEIVGTESTLAADFLSARVERRGSDGARTTWECTEDADRNRMYLAEMKDFLDCLGGTEAPPQNLAAGRRVLAVAWAAHDSARRGCAVSLP